MILEQQHFDLQEKPILARYVFRPPLKVPHKMEEQACFVFALNGAAEMYNPLGKEELNPDEGLLMKCGNYVNKWGSKDGKSAMEIIIVWLYPEVISDIYQNQFPTFLTEKQARPTKSIRKVKGNLLMRKYMDSLLFYFKNPVLVDDELVALKVKELLLLLSKIDFNGQVADLINSLFTPDIYSFKQIVEAHIFDDLAIQDLAVLCRLSTATFNRKFKEIYQESPARFIKQKRLQQAVHFLKNSEKTITEICYDCGFGDAGHFSKVFRSHFGQSPREFRKN